VMMWANRNGLFYVIDRTTGQFLLGKPFVEVNWMNGFDEKGRPMRVPGKVPTPEGTLIKPGNQGGTNWYSPSYSPHTGMFYIPAWEYSSVYFKQPVEYTAGRLFAGAMPQSAVPMVRSGQINQKRDDEGYGAVRALDPNTGERKWEFRMADVTDSGILTTATDLLFVGGREGYFFALDARNGSMLWKANTGGQVSSGPMTYVAGGRQYIAVASGSSLFVFALREPR
jgi:alcohol dehydrogenase (cytochrome c)